MNFSSVVEDLVYDKGLDKDRVLRVVSDGIAAAFKAKWPNSSFQVSLDKNVASGFAVLVRKAVVPVVADPEVEISLKKASVIDPAAKEGAFVLVPFEEKLGRIDILVAKDFISEAIRRLEQDHVYQIFKGRVGELVSGTLHKQEFSGYAVNLGEAQAFLPKSNAGDLEFRSGAPIKAVLREVLQYTGKGYQVVLDRSSVDYVVKMLSLEIPEIFQGVVEVVGAERIFGYKTKVMVRSKAKNIDPVGACVGLAGSRIKPILADLGRERIDLIPWIDDREMLLQKVLKPGEIVQSSFSSDGKRVVIVVEPDQKSLIIGKNGGNINLASRLLGVEIKIRQDEEVREFGSE